MSPFLEHLGTAAAPQMFAYLSSIGAMETMDIISRTEAQAEDGALTDGAEETTDHAAIPVNVSPAGKGDRIQTGDQISSINQYILTFEVNTPAGARINLDPKKHFLRVRARDPEPVKEFRIISVGDATGVVFQVVCSREN